VIRISCLRVTTPIIARWGAGVGFHGGNKRSADSAIRFSPAPLPDSGKITPRLRGYKRIRLRIRLRKKARKKEAEV